MNRNDIVRTVIAVVLALLVLIIWQQYFGPKPGGAPVQPPAATAPAAASEAPTAAQQPAPTTAAPTVTPVAAGPAVSGDPKSPPLTVTTTRDEMVLSPRGGRILSWNPRDHQRVPGDEKSGVVDLVSSELCVESSEARQPKASAQGSGPHAGRRVRMTLARPMPMAASVNG